MKPCKRGHISGRYKSGGCVECRRAQSRLQHERNPKRWFETPVEKRRDWARKAHLRRTFGLSLDDLKGMLERQDWGCAICRDPISDVHGCAVDHCHVSGAVRGALCRNCNLLLGHAKDSEAVLKAAIAYLQFFKL